MQEIQNEDEARRRSHVSAEEAVMQVEEQYPMVPSPIYSPQEPDRTPGYDRLNEAIRNFGEAASECSDQGETQNETDRTKRHRSETGCYDEKTRRTEKLASITNYI